jgi:hypothetical protein
MDTLAHWYWLGFILADGTLLIRERGRRHEHRLRVRLREEDRAHLEALARFLKFDGTIKAEPRALAKLSIYSPRIVLRLLELGVAPRKSFAGHPMPVVPKASTHAFARGHFDANGHISPVGKRILKIGFSGQHRLMRWFQETIALLVGAKPGLFYDKGGCAELVYGQQVQIEAVLRWLYGRDDCAPEEPCLARKRVIAEAVLSRGRTHG